MARKKISELTSTDMANASDQIPIVQGGVTKRVPVSSLVANGSGANVGGELEIFKDVSGGALRHRTIDPTGDSNGTSGNQGANVLNLRPVPPGHYNIKDYGATGDGVTDDSAAIQAAIAAVPFGGAGWNNPYILFIPPGTYRIATTIDIVRSIIIRGAGSHRYCDANVLGTSIFLVDDGVTGFKSWHGNMGYADSAHGKGAVLEDVTVRAAGHAVAGGVGLRMCTPMEINRCTFEKFSSHGIWIDAAVGLPDLWLITWTRCTENGGDGLHVTGQDANAGVAIGLDCQWNKGYGIYDFSFLGNRYIGTHCAENCAGAFSFPVTPGASELIGAYVEGGQPPSRLEGNNLTVIGGYDESGHTPASKFWGGYHQSMRSAAFVSTDSISVTPAGTDPPEARLKGTLTAGQTLNLVVQITTAGYPDGKDGWGSAAGATAQYRWSNNGGSSWNGPFNMGAAWSPYSLGLSKFAITGTGMEFVFVPGYYATDNVYTSSTASGAAIAFMRPGSNDGGHAAWSWGHLTPGDAGNDSGGFHMFWDSSTKSWALRWAGNYAQYQHMHFSSALPRPGHVTHDDGAWFGSAASGFSLNRITGARADNAVGSATWLTDAGVDSGLVGWFTAGDLVVNRSSAEKWPRAWRAMESGGWGKNNVGTDQAWVAATGYQPGDSIKESSSVFRCIVGGTTHAVTEPTWTFVRGDTFVDGTVTWECVGPHGASIFEPVGIQSEGLGTYAVTADDTLTLAESSYERLKLTGTPGATRSLVMPSVTGANGWARVIWNATDATQTVKGSAEDTGITIPIGKAWDVISDGTNCVRVE